jgi:hypothetical protein
MEPRYRIETELQRVWDANVPAAAVIAQHVVTEALSRCGNDPQWCKEHFSELTEQVQAAGQQFYLEAQQQAVRAAFREVLLPLAGDHADSGDIAQVLGDHVQHLERFFVGLNQARRPHAKIFELLVCKLIALNYAYTAQTVIPGQPDFILPSIEHFRRTPADTLVFSVKKTVRDRWRQMLTETAKPRGIYIATLDDEISHHDLAAMVPAHVWIVVPARIKSARQHYVAAPNVMSFESFCHLHLDPAVERWHAAGVYGPSVPKVSAPRPESKPDRMPPGFGPSVRSSGLRRTLDLAQGLLFE